MRAAELGGRENGPRGMETRVLMRFRLATSLAGYLLGISILLACQTAAPRSFADTLPAGFEVVSSGLMAPKVIFLDENGLPTSIDAFKDKIVVLNLWATWCAPCVKEMPSLERLASRLSNDRFAVVAVSQDKGGMAVAKPFLDKLGVRGLLVYSDPTGRLSREYGGRGMPTTFIVGKDGKLIARLEGSADWDAKEIVAYLTAMAD